MTCESAAPATVAAPPGAVDFRAFSPALRADGVAGTPDLFALAGDVVCGHPDRHVRRVNLGGKKYFLKLEHVVGLPAKVANWRAGAGFVGRCERELAVLDALDRAGFPTPRVAAFAKLGDRAALLLEAADGVNLNDIVLSPAARRDAATRLGFALAELHAAGFDTPDLAAKHVFVHPDTFRVTLVDWQNCRPGRAVSFRSRLKALAALAATATGSISDKLRVLAAYVTASGPGFPPLKWWVRKLSGVRVRHHVAPPSDQVLTWVRGEEIVARGDSAGWDTARPWYPARGEPVTLGRPIPVTLPAGGVGSVTRFRTVPTPRPLERLLGKPWLAPTAEIARVVFRLETAGAPAPKLAGFGQRRDGWSFAATTLPPDSDPFPFAAASKEMLEDLGRGLRLVHAAKVRVTKSAAVRVANGRVIFDPCAGLRYEKHLTPARKDADVQLLLNALPSAARLGVLAAYHAGDAAGLRAALKTLARKAGR